jgi:hypothetical protein
MINFCAHGAATPATSVVAMLVPLMRFRMTKGIAAFRSIQTVASRPF